jgi:hypothetical protein
MRLMAAIVLAVLSAMPVAASAPSVDELFLEFGLFGSWAADCKQPATPDNPHVGITMPSPGLVLEDHNLGADFAINRYSVLSAARVSAEGISVEVIFQPGSANEERQTLVFLVHNGSRRTMFNQPVGGEVRVKDGIALAHHTKTPLLQKCE